MATFEAVGLVDNPRHLGRYGNCNVYDGVVTPTAGALNDVYKPLRLPAGFRLTSLEIDNADLDSDSTPTIACKIGYSPVLTSPTEDDDYFGSALTILQAAARTQLAFAPILFSFPVDVIITLTTAAATFASGRVTAIAYGENVGIK